MKTKLFALLLVAAGSLFAETHVSIGVQLGRGYGYYPPPPPRVVAYRPACPGPGYMWIDGYYDPYGSWSNGYWAMPPYPGAYWIAPRYNSGRFYPGYWGGSRNFREREWRREMRERRDYGRERDRDWDDRRWDDRRGFRR